MTNERLTEILHLVKTFRITNTTWCSEIIQELVGEVKNKENMIFKLIEEGYKERRELESKLQEYADQDAYDFIHNRNREVDDESC